MGRPLISINHIKEIKVFVVGVLVCSDSSLITLGCYCAVLARTELVCVCCFCGFGVGLCTFDCFLLLTCGCDRYGEFFLNDECIR